jgi:SAM-dependent methyltransferase
VTDVSPRLFDTSLARARLARAAPQSLAFLADAVVNEIGERIDLVVRHFKSTVVHRIGAEATAQRLALTARFGNVLVAGAHPSSPGDLMFDPEALPFAPNSLDCMVSLLTLQGVNDLPGALIQMRRALRPDGLLLACLFAATTLGELRSAWLEAESHAAGGVSPRVSPFADLRELGALLQRAGFALPVADSDRTIVRYPDALSLMREIKLLGFGNCLVGRSRRLVTRKLLLDAATAYERDFSDADGKVRATVEVAWLTAWSPHESQQQPLKPGSAKARLADALNTTEKRLPRD